MKNAMTIVIAEDQEIYLDGLLLTLKAEPNVRVAGQAENGSELIDVVERVKPDIVLTDIMMPVMDGIEACKIITARQPATVVVAMTVFEEHSLIMEMIEAGAAGFVMKNSGKEELLDVIEKAYTRGGSYCSRTNRRLTEFWGKRNAKLKLPHFSAREMEVMELICEGLTHHEIAGKLYVSKKTVDSCSHRILQKTGERNVVGLIKYAIANGLYALNKERD